MSPTWGSLPNAGEGGVSQPDASPQQSSSPGDDKGARKPIQVGEIFEAKRLDTPLDKMTRERAGKRSYTRTDRKRGRYIKSRPAGDHPEDIAFDATLRAAAPYQNATQGDRTQRPWPSICARATCSARSASAAPAI